MMCLTMILVPDQTYEVVKDALVPFRQTGSSWRAHLIIDGL